MHNHKLYRINAAKKKHVSVYQMAHIILPRTSNENIIDVIKD